LSLLADFLRALAQMNDPRFRRVLWRSALVVLAGFAALAWAFVALLGWVLPDTTTLPWIGEVGFIDTLASSAAVLLVIGLSVILMIPATAATVGFFLDDVVEAVEARHYPGLPPARPPGLGRQSLDALRFFGLIVMANAAAFAVYLIVPPLAPFAFLGVNGLLLGREYFQLVALRRLDRAAAVKLLRRHSGRIWLAGVLMAIPLSLPFVNLFVPIFGAAVFTHQFHRLATGLR
jgi:CysZ protein